MNGRARTRITAIAVDEIEIHVLPGQCFRERVAEVEGNVDIALFIANDIQALTTKARSHLGARDFISLETAKHLAKIADPATESTFPARMPVLQDAAMRPDALAAAETAKRLNIGGARPSQAALYAKPKPIQSTLQPMAETVSERPWGERHGLVFRDGVDRSYALASLSHWSERQARGFEGESRVETESRGSSSGLVRFRHCFDQRDPNLSRLILASPMTSLYETRENFID